MFYIRYSRLFWIYLKKTSTRNSQLFNCLTLRRLTLFRMGFFGGMHGWGEREQKGPTSLKSVTHILQWRNLAQLYLTKNRSKKYVHQVTHLLSSADLNNFSPEISKFCYIKKCMYRLHFDTKFLIILTFLQSLKIF